jgi:uncharacterized protein
MKITFIIISLSILLSINSYVILRGYQVLPALYAIRSTYLVGMIALFIVMMVTMILGNEISPVIAKTFSFIGFSYVIIFVYLLFSFLLVDFIRVINHFIHFFPISVASFRLWIMVITLTITAVAMIIGNYKFNHPKITTLNLSTDKPKQNKTLKIVAVSDLHLGISIDKKMMQGYVKLINNQHPDIVLLAGDVSDRWMEPVIRQNMLEELKSIKAPMGVFAINGNHEHYAEIQNATADYLKKAGIVVLRDQVNMVNSRFYIVGREDKSNPNRKKLSEIVKGLDENLPLILMDHQPHNLEEAEQNGVDLQISGHTHNGQFFPGNLFVKKMYEMGYGYLKKGATHYYVSSGLGIWGPQYRIGSESELVVVNLKY